MTVGLVSSIAVISANFIVVAVTWIRTFHHVKEASHLDVNVSVSAILLRDGERISVVPCSFSTKQSMQAVCIFCMFWFVYLSPHRAKPKQYSTLLFLNIAEIIIDNVVSFAMAV